MPHDRAGMTPSQLRELTRGLASASDEQVARVVAVVDGLPDRGGADALIAPLRPRLARLRPPRPLRFARLLFLPLEPLIVPPPRWQPDRPTIPRSVLAPLAATVRAGLGADAAPIDAAMQHAAAHDTAVVIRAGGLLWPRAAEVLAAAPSPVGWGGSGLDPSLYPPLARRIAAVLKQALPVLDLAVEAEAGIAAPRLAPVDAMLAEIAPHGPDALNMLVSLLLAKVPALAPLLPGLAVEQGPQVQQALRLAMQQAADLLLAGLEAGAGPTAAAAGRDLADAVPEVRRTIALLEQLAQRPDLPQGRARVQAVRQRLDAGCRKLFADTVATEFLPELREAPAAAALEATARRLRELESEARVLGGGAEYDAGLRRAASAVQALDAGLNKAARARLVEILAGPEAALAIWQGR